MRFRILELCKEAGINQTELAEKIGLSRVGLSKAIMATPLLVHWKKSPMLWVSQ